MFENLEVSNLGKLPEICIGECDCLITFCNIYCNQAFEGEQITTKKGIVNKRIVKM